MPLEFRFDELETEVRNFMKVAKDFLDPSAEQVVRAWLEELDGARGAPADNRVRWHISQNRPIRTLPCTYDQNSRDPHIEGRLSMIWEVEIPRGAPRGKGNRSPVFQLTGIASSLASIWQYSKDDCTEVARWSFEVGTDQSPGCHFHVQIKGDMEDRLFPPTLSVPRLPGILVTPVDALDFVLGEVFQDAWWRHLGRESTELNTWSRIQRNRMSRLLDWHKQQVANSHGAVWSRLKRAKPGTKELLSDY